VNSDCGAKALAFDRIQVNALERIVTAEAGMVEVGLAIMSKPAFSEKSPTFECGASRRGVSILRPT
jgi:hypothetical protein